MYCLPVIHVDYNTQLPLNQTFGVRTAVLTSGFHIWADWLSLMDKIWVLEKSLPHGRDKSMCDESECEMQEGIIGVYGKCFKCVCMGVSFVYRYQIEKKSRKYFPSPQLLFTWSPTQKYPHIQNALERHRYIHMHRYTNTRKPLQENHARLKTLGLFIKVSSSNIFSCSMLKSPMASGQSV